MSTRYIIAETREAAERVAALDVRHPQTYAEAAALLAGYPLPEQSRLRVFDVEVRALSWPAALIRTAAVFAGFAMMIVAAGVSTII